MRRSAPSPWRGTDCRRLSILSKDQFVKAGGVIGYGNVLTARTNAGYRRNWIDPGVSCKGDLPAQCRRLSRNHINAPCTSRLITGIVRCRRGVRDR